MRTSKNYFASLSVTNNLQGRETVGIVQGNVLYVDDAYFFSETYFFHHSVRLSLAWRGVVSHWICVQPSAAFVPNDMLSLQLNLLYFS